MIPEHIEQPKQRQDDSMVAWNLSTTLYYKSGGRPWQLADIRAGVCCIGLVFKKDETEITEKNVCCGAQLFLSNGEGVVFKVAKGNYQTRTKDEYYLPKSDAKLLIQLAINSYKRSMGGQNPSEIFIHGRTRFTREEYEGFQEACPENTVVNCIRIQTGNKLKLYTLREMPIMRGMAYFDDNEDVAYLWTRGYVPNIKTYPGREVPNPISIELVHGNAKIKEILHDILALTKVNFNSCIYGDGLPVTIRFANAVGEILTSAPIEEGAPLPFRHYI